MGSKKITINVITSGRLDPSSRFRQLQYIDNFINSGRYHLIISNPIISKYFQFNFSNKSINFISKVLLFVIKVFSRIPALYRSHNCDITWFNRELLSGRSSFEHYFNGLKVIDIDDGIWISDNTKLESHIAKILKGMDIVIAGNDYIASWAKKYCKNVYSIPTGLSTSKYYVPNRRSDNNQITIGWTGTKHTLKYLYKLKDSLEFLFNEHENLLLLIISDAPPASDFLSNRNLQWIQWTELNESSALDIVDIGIMPLENDEWSMYKCSFKMIQYMSKGIPVVVTPIGLNYDILNQSFVGFGANTSEQWILYLNRLINDKELRILAGHNGRILAEIKYDSNVIFNSLSSIFKSHVV